MSLVKLFKRAIYSVEVRNPFTLVQVRNKNGGNTRIRVTGYGIYEDMSGEALKMGYDGNFYYVNGERL